MSAINRSAVVWAAVAFMAGLSVRAASREWTGNAGDGKWNTSGNWSGSAVPQTGDEVTVSGAGAVAGEIENDIAGLTLSKLTFTGPVPFRLKGAGIALGQSGDCLYFSTQAPVTNAVDLALSEGQCHVTLASKDVVLEGVISGEGASLYFTGSQSGMVVLAGDNTYGGGTRYHLTSGLGLAHTNGFGKAGSTVEFKGTVLFFAPGDIPYNIIQPSSGNFYCNMNFMTSGTYNFLGTVAASNCTGAVQLLCGKSGIPSVQSGEIVFHKPANFGTALLKSTLKSDWTLKFLAPATLKGFDGHSGYSGIWSIAEFYATNTLTSLTPSYSTRIYLKTPNAFPGLPVVRFNRYMSEGTGNASGVMDLFGNDQGFDRLESDPAYPNRGVIKTTGGAATLSLFGTDDASTFALLDGALSVVWAPEDENHTQTFSNRVHTMTGDLIVSNGTLAAEGTVSFAQAKRIVVMEGGRFLLNTTQTGALAGVTEIVVAPGGTFEVVAAPTPFTAGAALLNFAAGAHFILPATDCYDLRGITLDGVPLDGNVYTAATLPGLQGGSLIARGFVPERTEATWDAGASPDDSIAGAANWTDDATPSLLTGSLNALFGTGGAQALLDRDIDLLGIRFARNFTLAGNGALTLRDEGVTVAKACTNAIDAPVKLRGAQEWNVDVKGRLDVNGGIVASKYGTYSIHKTGPGELWLNAPCEGLDAFTLGSTSVTGGCVYVNAPTNAFGLAGDSEIRICAKTSSNPASGSAVFAASTVVERPIRFECNGAYFAFTVLKDVSVRFTRMFTAMGDLRMSFKGNNEFICEAGATIAGGWTCFSGSALWTFRGDTPSNLYYMYMAGGTSVRLETPTNIIDTLNIKSASTLTAAVPYALCAKDEDRKRLAVGMNHANAVIAVTGDQKLGRFYALAGGMITSDVPSTVHFAQPQGYPVTNSAVRIAGEVMLYKRGPALFVQDHAVDTAGGIGVGEGTLQLTASAVLPHARKFLVEGTGRAEVTAQGLLGRDVEVFYDDTATLALAADQRVSTFHVNGVRQRSGVYGSSASGAPNVMPGFEGAGRLIVCRRGLRIDLR